MADRLKNSSYFLSSAEGGSKVWSWVLPLQVLALLVLYYSVNRSLVYTRTKLGNHVQVYQLCEKTHR